MKNIVTGGGERSNSARNPKAAKIVVACNFNVLRIEVV